MRSLFISGLAVAVVLALAWIGGFDFDERGGKAFFVATMVVIVGLWAWFASKVWEEDLL